MSSASAFIRRQFELRCVVRNAIAITALVGGGIWLWFGVVRHWVIAKRFGEVTPAVYRSGMISPHVIERVLDSNKIECIVDLTGIEWGLDRKVTETEAAKVRGIEIHRYPLEGDGTGSVDSYVSALRDLIEADRTGKRTLVHCAAGAYRTGGVVAMFRMLHQGWTAEQAFQEATKYDWKPDDWILPNYLADHMDEIRQRLIDDGVLPTDAPKPVIARRAERSKQIAREM